MAWMNTQQFSNPFDGGQVASIKAAQNGIDTAENEMDAAGDTPLIETLGYNQVKADDVIPSQSNSDGTTAGITDPCARKKGVPDFQISGRINPGGQPQVESQPDIVHTTEHEFGHAIDDVLGQYGTDANGKPTGFLSNSTQFQQAFQNDYNAFYAEYQSQLAGNPPSPGWQAITYADASTMQYYLSHPQECFADLFAAGLDVANGHPNYTTGYGGHMPAGDLNTMAKQSKQLLNTDLNLAKAALKAGTFKPVRDCTDPKKMVMNPSPIIQSTKFQVVDPLIISLNGQGIQTTSLTNGNFFDMYDTGFANQTAWISANDGFLALDTNNDGLVQTGNQLFGTSMPLANGSLASSGFAALAQYDTNHSGTIDSSDAVWSQLGVLEANGTFETLSQLGIQSISLNTSANGAIDANGNQDLLDSTFTTSSGTVGQISDYALQENTELSNPTNPVDVTDTTITALPDVEGSGQVSDLWESMQADNTGALKSLVQSFESTTNQSQQNALLQEIIFKWAGTDQVAQNAFGPHIDGRIEATINKFYGQTLSFSSSNGGTTENPGVFQLPYLLDSYNSLQESVYAQLELGGSLAQLNADLVSGWYTDPITGAEMYDLSTAANDIISQDQSNHNATVLELTSFIRALNGMDLIPFTNYAVFANDISTQAPDLIPVLTASNANPNSTINGDLLNFSGSSEAQIITADGSNDQILLGLGDTTLNAVGNNEYIVGGGGNDSINLTGTNDLLYLGYGNSTVHSNGSNVIKGAFFQPDVTSGTATIYVGKGDSIYAGGYNDIYVVGEGLGALVINEGSAAATGSSDRITFGTGISENSLSFAFQNSYSDLLITLNDGKNDSVLLTQEVLSITSNYVSSLTFADGNSYSIGSLTKNGVLVSITESNNAYINRSASPVTENDVISGSNDYIYLNNQNDFINLSGTNDYITAGTGVNKIVDTGTHNTIDTTHSTQSQTITAGINDTIKGGSSTTTITAAANDTITLLGGTSTIKAGANDVINLGTATATITGASNDVINNYGSTANLTITVGANDVLNATEGNNVVTIGSGLGTTKINETGEYVPGDFDTLSFGTGITSSDLTFSSTESDLQINLGTGKGSVYITGEFAQYEKQATTFKFSGASTETLAQLLAGGLTVANTTSNSTLDRSQSPANETITNSGKNDVILLGSGNDTYTDTGSVNYISLGSGNDTINVGANDTIYSGGGKDNFSIQEGMGLITIVEAIAPVVAGTNDTVNLGTGFSKANVTATSDGSGDLLINLGHANDSIVLQNGLDNLQKPIGSFVFSDGTLTLSQIIAMAVTTVTNSQNSVTVDESGTTGKVVVTNTGSFDTIKLGSGTDAVSDTGQNSYIYAGSGNDSITAGKNDYIYDGSGRDTYNINKGSDGVIVNLSTAGTNSSITDTVAFGAGISLSSLTLNTNQYQDLVINEGNGANDVLTLSHALDPANPKQIGNFTFANNSTVSLAAMLARGVNLTDSTNNGYLNEQFTSAKEIIVHTGINDQIDPGSGNDVVTLGKNDTVYSGSGQDTYNVNVGSGTSTIYEYTAPTIAGTTDMVVFGSGITNAGITLSSDANGDLILNLNSNDKLDLAYALGNSPNDLKPVNTFLFADGSSLSFAQLVQRGDTVTDATNNGYINHSAITENETITHTGTNDQIDPGSGNDLVTVGKNDTIYGGTGQDTYQVNAGSGTTTVYEYNNATIAGTTDIMKFGTGIANTSVTLSSDANNDLILNLNGTDKVDLAYALAGSTNDKKPVNTFEFSDGTSLTLAQLLQRGVNITDSTNNGGIYRSSSTVNENIVHTGINDQIDPGSGNDVVTLGHNDTVYSGTGQDTYVVNEGSNNSTIYSFQTPTAAFQSDVIDFGTGISEANITLQSNTNGDLILNLDGTDKLDLAYALSGITADDTKPINAFNFADGTSVTFDELLQLGVTYSSSNSYINRSSSTTDDVIVHSGSNDQIDLGSGSDQITMGTNDIVYGGTGFDNFDINQGSGFTTIYENETPSISGMTDQLTFGTGITNAGLTLNIDSNNDLILNLEGSDKVDLISELSSTDPKPVDTFTFTDGTVLALSDLLARGVTLDDATNNGFINQSSSSLNETIVHTGMNDQIDAGSGNDSITLGHNDTVFGGTGQDSITVNQGSGNSEIYEYNPPTVAGTTDIMNFGSGITNAAVTLNSDSSDDLILNLGGSDHVTLEYALNSTNDKKPVGTFNFSGGPTLTLAQLESRGDTMDDSTSNGSIYRSGISLNETIVHTGTNDVITPGSGNDTITVGKNDTVYGGAGLDTFDVNTGSGLSTIYEFTTPTVGGTTDIMQFGSGITNSAITLTSDANYDLILKLNANDSVNLGYALEGTVNDDKPVSTFKFTGGSTVTLAQLLSRGVTVSNSASNANVYRSLSTANETILNSGKNDYIVAGNGNDTITDTGAGASKIYAGTGNDTMTGANNDYLGSGSGIDLFNYTKGSGPVEIAEGVTARISGSNDTLNFGTGIALTSLSLYSHGTTLTIKDGTGNDAITIDNELSTSGGKIINTFEFAGASAMTLAQLETSRGVTPDVLKGGGPIAVDSAATTTTNSVANTTTTTTTPVSTPAPPAPSESNDRKTQHKQTTLDFDKFVSSYQTNYSQQFGPLTSDSNSPSTNSSSTSNDSTSSQASRSATSPPAPVQQDKSSITHHDVNLVVQHMTSFGVNEAGAATLTPGTTPPPQPIPLVTTHAA